MLSFSKNLGTFVDPKVSIAVERGDFGGKAARSLADVGDCDAHRCYVLFVWLAHCKRILGCLLRREIERILSSRIRLICSLNPLGACNGYGNKCLGWQRIDQSLLDSCKS